MSSDEKNKSDVITVKAKTINLGDRSGHDMTPPIDAAEIPPAPVLKVPLALKSMQLQSGFSLDNVAAEPYVFSPVAMSFDEKGRMWIAEMTTFMPNLDGEGEEIPTGNIVILEDTDHDGSVDKRTVFLNDIILPRTIAIVKGGIIYSDQEKLYFAEVKKGDKLGIRDVIDPTYAKGGSVEHKPNGMLYGLDNWYYNAKSDRRYKLLPLDAPMPKDAKEIYRNHLWKMGLAKTDYRGQWGLSTDDYGRLFHNWNSVPSQGEFLRPNSLMKNSGLKEQLKAHSIGGNRVYPIRINPGVNRAYMEHTLVSEGEHKGKLANFTAASGNVVYRGDQFPPNFYGVTFTPEPGANLISARRIIENQGELSGEELYPESEVLASTDERFRPVNLYTAPDGTLYIVDMYHGVIQHKEFLTSYLRKQAEARGLDKFNNTLGRIYRLRWTDNKLGSQPNLHTKSAKELVPYLAHNNGWWRDTARRLIIEKNDPNVAPLITQLIISSDDHRAKINALWTLEGLNALNLQAVKAGLNAKHAKVQISAIELTSRLTTTEQQILSKRLAELSGGEYQVALQIALTAGELKTDNAFELIKNVLAKYGGFSHVNQAVISGVAAREGELEKYLGTEMKEDFAKLFNTIGKKKIIASNINNLTTRVQGQYWRGKSLFDERAACVGCHGKQGQGLEGLAPPLANSDWVTGKPERLLKVLLHGLNGPITVTGKKYNLPMVMPGLGDNSSFSDADIADIATYIRNNWGNEASAVSIDLAAKIRQQTVKQKRPYTGNELSN